MARTQDLLEIIETAYTLDGPDEEWFGALAASVHANVPFPVLDVVATGYDISDPDRPLFVQGLRSASNDQPGMLQG